MCDVYHKKEEIEAFIRQWDGTAIGFEVKNMLANSNETEDSLDDIIERMDSVR